MQHVELDSVEYAVGIVRGLSSGCKDALEEVVPSMLSAVKAGSHGLWAMVEDDSTGIPSMVNDPSDYFNRFIRDGKLCVEDALARLEEMRDNEEIQNMLNEYGEYFSGEFIEGMVSELSDLLRDYAKMSDIERGEKTGYVFGKYGTEICLTFYSGQAVISGSTKAIKLARQLGKSNRCLSMETMLSSKAARNMIAQAAMERKALCCSDRLLEFVPKILPGNKSWGMRHIIKKHSFESTARRASRFSKGLKEEEIRSLIEEAVKRGGLYSLDRGKFIMEVDMKRIIGLTEDNKPAQFIKVVVNQNGNLVTAYPK